jgi:hypothetical protein
MKPTAKRALISMMLGIVVTASGFVAACAASGSYLAWIFYWQGYLLQSCIPAPNLGSPDHPLYEATPAHFVAFYLGIPFGVLLYSLLAFAVLGRFRSAART